MGRIIYLTMFMRSLIGISGIVIGAVGLPDIVVAQSEADSSAIVIAHGGGTTIVEGGTGKSGGFIPVLTTLAFHAEKKAGTVTGSFECLARAPQSATGGGSADFNVNVMYVTGQITRATVMRNMATLTGTAEITGLGAGSNVPFTLVVRAGGPGSAAVLTTEGSPPLVFNETLVTGSFSIFPGHRRE